MAEFYTTNRYPVLIDNIVHDHLVKIKASLFERRIGNGFLIYDPTTKIVQSLGAFIFKNNPKISRYRKNTESQSRDSLTYCDYTIRNMKAGTEFHERITNNNYQSLIIDPCFLIDNTDHSGKTDNSNNYISAEMTNTEKQFSRLGDYEKSLVVELVEDMFRISKKLEIDSNIIANIVLNLMEEKRKKYSNRQKIMKLKSDIIDKEKEIEIIQSGYYK